MSAPRDAYRIGDYFDNPINWRVKCPCGWKGVVEDLLGVDTQDTLWCPKCRRIGWVYI